MPLGTDDVSMHSDSVGDSLVPHAAEAAMQANHIIQAM